MTPLSPSIAACRHSMAGSALIMVIWLIAMLGMIVYAMTSIISQDLKLTIAQQQAFRARQVAEMGINWAMNPAVKKYDRDILDQTLDDGSTFSAKIRGEGGRMNINALLQNMNEKAFMTTLLALWGVGNDEADMLFDRMVDWIDADSNTTGTKGWEKEDYIANGFGERTPYPFNRAFYNLDELALVPGFKEEVIARVPDWRDYFTIYSSGKAVDVNAAEAKVLATVMIAAQGDPDVDELERMMGKAQDFVELRWGPDGIEDTKDDDEKMNAQTFLDSVGFTPDPAAPGAEAYFGGNDQTTHIECVATVGDYRKRVVLIVRGRTGTPQILSREEVPLFQ